MRFERNRATKTIAKNIILAQIASDAGKGIYNGNRCGEAWVNSYGECHWRNDIRDNTDWRLIDILPEKEIEKAESLGYKMKNVYIQRAIDAINRNETGFKYAYKDGIVYFQWENGTIRQISFHGYNQRKSKFNMNWDSLCLSRKNAYYLGRWLN